MPLCWGDPVCPSVSPSHLGNTLREFPHIYRKLRQEGYLYRVWCTKSKGQCGLLNSLFSHKTRIHIRMKFHTNVKQNEMMSFYFKKAKGQLQCGIIKHLSGHDLTPYHGDRRDHTSSSVWYWIRETNLGCSPKISCAADLNASLQQPYLKHCSPFWSNVHRHTTARWSFFFFIFFYRKLVKNTDLKKPHWNIH